MACHQSRDKYGTEKGDPVGETMCFSDNKILGNIEKQSIKFVLIHRWLKWKFHKSFMKLVLCMQIIQIA